MRHHLSTLLSIVACPICNSKLSLLSDESSLECLSCRESYEVKDGIPVLISPEGKKRVSTSLSQTQVEKWTSRPSRKSIFGYLAQISVPPSPVLNTGARSGFTYFRQLLDEKTKEPNLLIVGCGSKPGESMHILGEPLLRNFRHLVINPAS